MANKVRKEFRLAKAGVRVYEPDYEWLYLEAKSLGTGPSTEPSYAEILHSILDQYRSHKKGSQSPDNAGGYSTGGPLNVGTGTAILPEFRRWHWMLERVLESRNDEAIDTVQLNLRLLYRNIGGDPDHVDREISNSWKPGVRTDVVAESGGHPGSEIADQKIETHNTKKRGRALRGSGAA